MRLWLMKRWVGGSNLLLWVLTHQHWERGAAGFHAKQTPIALLTGPSSVLSGRPKTSVCLPEEATVKETETSFLQACQKSGAEQEGQKSRQDRKTPDAELSLTANSVWLHCGFSLGSQLGLMQPWKWVAVGQQGALTAPGHHLHNECQKVHWLALEAHISSTRGPGAGERDHKKRCWGACHLLFLQALGCLLWSCLANRGDQGQATAPDLRSGKEPGVASQGPWWVQVNARGRQPNYPFIPCAPQCLFWAHCLSGEVWVMVAPFWACLPGWAGAYAAESCQGLAQVCPSASRAWCPWQLCSSQNALLSKGPGQPMPPHGAFSCWKCQQNENPQVQIIWQVLLDLSWCAVQCWTVWQDMQGDSM